MLNINYEEGRGHVQIDLEALLPCSAGDFKRLLSFVDKSDRPAEHAATIYNHIAEKVAALKEERERENPNTAKGKERISRVNATLKKYFAHAATLTKVYGLPELENDAAKITLKPATVYSFVWDSGKSTIKVFDGWTFEKDGFVFDVYKYTAGKTCSYVILLHGTGRKVGSANKKSACIAEITPDTIKVLTESAEKIAGYEQEFKKMMVSAGYLEADERRENDTENTSEKKEVKNMKNMYTFTPDTVTCGGKTFPAEYNISTSGSVLVFAIIGEKADGRKEKQRILFTPDHADFAAALAAALASGAHDYRRPAVEKEEVRPENISEDKPAAAKEECHAAEKEEEKRPETISEDEPAAARDPKQARGPVPEKTFTGDVIQGRGWKILFDGETSRTRIIFDGKPTDAARAAIENAGFYYSSKMNSWNKKLTWKAYRAAKAVSGELSTLYAA